MNPPKEGFVLSFLYQRDDLVNEVGIYWTKENEDGTFEFEELSLSDIQDFLEDKAKAPSIPDIIPSTEGLIMKRLVPVIVTNFLTTKKPAD